MKLYENVVIGNFLYGLGFSIRSHLKSQTFPSIISLLQQTPADKVLGDLLIEFPGVVRVIEFKQRSNTSNKERLRLGQLKAALGDDPGMQQVSREIHWFIETDPAEKTFVSRIVPYLDAYPKDKQQHDFASFINTVARDAVEAKSVSSLDDQRRYLQLIAICQGGGEVSSGGLVVAISPEGNLQYVELTSMMELRLQHKEFVAKISARMEKWHEQALEKEHSMDKGNGR